MQSINEGRQDISVRQVASTATRRAEKRATHQAAMAGGAAFGILALLFLASFTYIAFGSKLEASSALNPELLIALVAEQPADTGGAARNEEPSGENIVVRCDKSAVAAANRVHEYGNNGRQWRRERLLAFQRCVDESFQRVQKLHR